MCETGNNSVGVCRVTEYFDDDFENLKLSISDDFLTKSQFFLYFEQERSEFIYGKKLKLVLFEPGGYADSNGGIFMSIA